MTTGTQERFMKRTRTILLSDHFKLFSGSSGKSLLEEIKKEDANIKKRRCKY